MPATQQFALDAAVSPSIKMVKRQMFGRVALPLLRERVLLTAQT